MYRSHDISKRDWLLCVTRKFIFQQLFLIKYFLKFLIIIPEFSKVKDKFSNIELSSLTPTKQS